MKPKDTALKELNSEGYRFKRHGANHDVYFNRKEMKQNREKQRR